MVRWWKLVVEWMRAALGLVRPRPAVDGVPNLYEVVPGRLWRSGQPVGADAWDSLFALGIRVIVKLNYESEGDDRDWMNGRGAGHITSSIPPDANWKSVLERPDPASVDAAVRAIESAASGQGSPTLVHCTHGQDRTGFVLGVWRVRCGGWTTSDAYEEMLQHGFHPELLGLSEAWKAFCEKGTWSV